MKNLRMRFAFLHDDEGSGTAWWVLWMLIFMVFGGVAADAANAWRMRAQLQSTADAAAHAGAIDLPNEAAAIASADAMAMANMEVAQHGDVLTEAEIEVGLWSAETQEFLKPTGSGGGSSGATGATAVKDAIRVTTRRDETNGNRLKTYFLRLVGMDSWNINAQAVAQRYFPECMNTDGLFARRIVDMQSNNHLRAGICIHGNDHVEANNGNTWDSGVSVTMPDVADLQIPSSDIDVHNPGLSDALGEEYFNLKIVDQTDYIMNELLDVSSPLQPSFIGIDAEGRAIDDNDILVTANANSFSLADVEAGHIYYVSCPGNSLLNLGNGVVLSKVVIIAQCRIFTGNNSRYSDVILGSFSGDKPNESQYSKAINIGQGNQMGSDDNCALSGNVKLISNGSIESAADQRFFGVQAVAVWDIKLTAQAEGLEGILLQAGNDVSITSNNSFGSTCSNLGAIEVPYFRLVL